MPVLGGRHEATMRTGSGVGRIAAIAAVVAAVVLVGFIVFGGGGGYTVKAYFENANQLVKGNQVELDGTPVGTVDGMAITPNGQAVITLSIDGKYARLPAGAHATMRQAWQSGRANRYVDRRMRPQSASHTAPTIPDGDQITVDKTTTGVDLAQLFNTLDPPT